MAISKETANTILNFKVGKKPEGVFRQSEDFGEIAPGISLRWGFVSFQQRAIHLLEEPLVFKTTTQPALYLEHANGDIRSARKALVYVADIIDIGGELAEKVANTLKVV